MLFERARRRLQETDCDTAPDIDAGGGMVLPCTHNGPKPVTYRFCSPACRTGFAHGIAGRGPIAAQLRTLGG